MHRSLRAFTGLLLLFLLGTALRGTADGETPQERMRAGHCPCREGKACWHFLRTPLRPPEDPCVCGLCASGGSCAEKERPEGWGADCMGSQKPACFWKRHAASWSVTCSECAADEECTSCGGLPGVPDADAREALKRQVALEASVGLSKRTPPPKGMFVGWTPRFYVATDILQMKVLTQGGAPRVMSGHEIVHLYLERAEKAYDDFVAVWGDEVRLGKPMGIFLARSNRKKEAWNLAYFGNVKTTMIYGGSPDGKVGGGFCWNGFATSGDDQSSDRDMHGYVRHMIGHLLFSCWHGVSGFQKDCPKWAFVGAADWLAKVHPFFADYTHFCHDEGGGASGSGKDWDKKARAVAAGTRPPIEKLFETASLSHLSYDDHVRSWSYMDTMLREDRERWLATMRLLREGRLHAAAFRDGLGMTPDEFDKRWADRMAGRRKTMADVPKDAAVADADGPNAAARRRITAETDPEILAALLRGLEKVTDVPTAKLVLSRLSVDSDLVRETVAMLLGRTETPEVLDWLRAAGLSDRDALVRATIARVLGNAKDAVSRPAFEVMLDDAHWLARANAARALEQIADPACIPALVAKVEDDNPKAWIAKVDALAVFGQAASKATVPVASRLGASDWQVRLSACRALAKIGDQDAVEPLIDRLESEGGRLHREILAALRAVTHETFGENPRTWREWWKKQKPQGLPPPPPDAPDPRYAPTKPLRPDEPTYYGRRIFSQSMLFVIDLSKSMDSFIRVPEAERARLGDLPEGPRLAVAKAAAKAAIAKLDPRARFNIVFFSTRVRPWQKGLVVAGGMKEQAISAIDGAGLEDETNIYGALRAALGLHERPTLAADLDPIPDTIYFLTDGTPTRGEITDTETILSWVRDVNRFAKVELHVIAMGNTGVDLDFLRRLATENGGEFVHVPDSR